MPPRDSSERLRVIVAGMAGSVPRQGGATWAVLQYVLGLRMLGHDAMLLDQPKGTADVDPATADSFMEVVRAFGLEERAAIVHAGSRTTVGVSSDRVRSFASSADVLLNLSGTLTDPDLLEHAPVRVWLDLDPAFNQVWAEQGIDLGFEAHTHFATVGVNVGTPGNPIPTGGRAWIPTLPPVALDHWPPTTDRPRRGLTTVANWRSYGPVEWNGARYGQKAHSIRELIELPTLVPVPVEVALAIHPDEERDLGALRRHGWTLVDPDDVAGTPGAYRDFVRGSWAELGIAKHGYVASESGWFGDRSACYLASGRPVLAQDTGFTSALPAGDGLLAFSTAEEAAAGVEEIRAHYDDHAAAARGLAEAYLDARTVLSSLLDRVTGSADALPSALAGALADHLGRPVTIRRLSRRASPYRSSFGLEELDVDLDEGGSLALVAKDLSAAGLSEPGRRARPAFLLEPAREHRAYEDLLRGAGLGTARWYGSGTDASTGRRWLFLERVPGVVLNQVGDFASWVAVARWLGTLHAAFAPRAAELRERDDLVRYDTELFLEWSERAAKFAERRDLAAADRRRLGAVLEAYPSVLERFHELPVTLVHGDFYPANVVVATNGDGPRVCPLDWELAGVGPGLLDLAALSSGRWDDTQREALAAAYRERLGPDGPTREDLLRGLDECRLHVSVQWLGWSEEWSPPADQANDWLAEAFAAAERLGIP